MPLSLQQEKTPWLAAEARFDEAATSSPAQRATLRKRIAPTPAWAKLPCDIQPPPPHKWHNETGGHFWQASRCRSNRRRTPGWPPKPALTKPRPASTWTTV